LILYLDSSALVKLFTEEPGAEAVRGAVGEAARSYTHLITYAEVRAALARARREGRGTPETLKVHKQELDTLWLELGIVVPDEALVRRAGDLAEEHELRGYDSVQLAAAEALWREIDSEVMFRFAVFDGALAEAAMRLGILVLSE
jgi:predicted nucleic acid-binding protein